MSGTRVQSADAVIIGGGPAGAVAGRELARCGMRVVIIERGERNRLATCGHCLNPRILPQLASIDLRKPIEAIAVGATRALGLHLPGRDAGPLPLTRGFPLAPGLIVRRTDLDQLLLDDAARHGAMVVQPATARIESGDAHAAVVAAAHGTTTTRWRTPLLVGADGLRSCVARHAGWSPSRTGRGYGFSFQIGDHGRHELRPETIEMFLDRTGYLGIVREAGGTLHIGALVLPREEQKLAPDAFVRAVANRFGLLRPLGLDRIRTTDMRPLTAAGPMPHAPERIADGARALIGDAAGYIEPLTGEGMTWAIESALLLARAVRDHGQWSAAAAQAYEEQWQRVIGRAQRRCRAIAWMARAPGVVRAVCGFPFGRQILAQQIAGRVAGGKAGGKVAAA